MSKIQETRNGFTLLELIMSIGILGILIGATISNFHDGARNQAVRQAANLTASLLRQAQSQTLSGIVSNGTFPAGGYGVRFDSTSAGALIFFADSNGNFNYDAGEDLAGERVIFPPGASFNLGASLNVVFSPPDGSVYFNGVAAPDTMAIPFRGTGTTVTANVTVYRLSGQVRVQ